MSSELRDLNDRWLRAWFEKDAETVDLFMADDYVYVAPNGMVLDRRAILEIIRSPTYRLDGGTRTEVVVRPTGGEAAIVRHRWQGSGAFEGTTFTEDHRCVAVWEQRAGQWRVVMEQSSFNSP